MRFGLCVSSVVVLSGVMLSLWWCVVRLVLVMLCLNVVGVWNVFS